MIFEGRKLTICGAIASLKNRDIFYLHILKINTPLYKCQKWRFARQISTRPLVALWFEGHCCACLVFQVSIVYKRISNKCFFRYRNIICCRTKKFDRQISTFGTYKAVYLLKKKV